MECVNSGKGKGFQTLGINARDLRFARVGSLPAWEVCPRLYHHTARGVRRAARGARAIKALLCDQWEIKPKSTMQTCIFCCARMHGLCNPIGSKRVCLLISKQRAPICAEDFAVAMIVCVFAAASERVYGAPAPAPYGGPPHSLHSPCPPTRTPHAGTAHAMRRKATSSRVITRQRRFCLRRSWLLTVSVYGPPVPARSPHAHGTCTRYKIDVPGTKWNLGSS